MPGQGDIIRGKPRDKLKNWEKQGLQAVDNRMDIHRDDMCVNEKFFRQRFFVQKPSQADTTLTQRLYARQAIVYKDKSGLIHRRCHR